MNGLQAWLQRFRATSANSAYGRMRQMGVLARPTMQMGRPPVHAAPVSGYPDVKRHYGSGPELTSLGSFDTFHGAHLRAASGAYHVPQSGFGGGGETVTGPVGTGSIGVGGRSVWGSWLPK